jgi:hypothetical protein
MSGVAHNRDGAQLQHAAQLDDARADGAVGGVQDDAVSRLQLPVILQQAVRDAHLACA